jgi:hypothetical protein
VFILLARKPLHLCNGGFAVTPLDFESTPIGDFLTFAKAAKLLPTVRGKGVSPTTLWRWSITGVLGIRLPTVLFGKTALTTKAALFEFLREVEAARRAAPSPCRAATSEADSQQPIQSPASRRKAVKAATEQLAKRHKIKVRKPKAKAR